tara:strand:+ start:1095 stop:1280 length:186 start_codon:yes stop_codon:yes gene_type:complete
MIDKMIITKAQWNEYKDNKKECIKATIDGVEMFVPLDEDNIHYAEIKRQVDAGELTIEDAD